ncbi:hypothetical protein ABZ780_22110 [Micromonospora sp. NPDC047467]|uniref:hypothetical protein n=1 Tax=Micromonospora sp. NPDC047467 TaxID=3154814 RepID=UPI00340A540D
MAREPLQATLIIKRHGGQEERWGFGISPDAPLDVEEPKETIVHEFIKDSPDPMRFDLSLGGSLAEPVFVLSERRPTIIVSQPKREG